MSEGKKLESALTLENLDLRRKASSQLHLQVDR